MASTKISDLSALTTTDGTEELLINAGGTSKKVTIDNLLHDESIDSDHYVDGSIDTAHISDDQVTYAKIQNISADERILGRVSGADGVIEELTKSNVLTMLNVEDGATADQSASDILTAIEDGIDSVHYKNGSIDNEHLADNAVGLAEMAGGTDGNIISYDASGDPVAIATGNDGQVLTSAGLGAQPAFEDAATGDLVDDTSPQLGGFLDADGNYMQTEKGGDLTSASPLVIDTDGDYFDVTGTTSFAVMTVAADRQFTLQFDGVLTMTHHATNIDLPSEANITTAAGDVATFQSTGANTVQCINYTRADGTAIVGASGVTLGFFEHTHTISSNLTITTDYNAISAGPITVASGYSVTVPSGSTWVIV